MLVKERPMYPCPYREETSREAPRETEVVAREERSLHCATQQSHRRGMEEKSWVASVEMTIVGWQVGLRSTGLDAAGKLKPIPPGSEEGRAETRPYKTKGREVRRV
jgi:hypothetical protein